MPTAKVEERRKQVRDALERNPRMPAETAVNLFLNLHRRFDNKSSTRHSLSEIRADLRKIKKELTSGNKPVSAQLFMSIERAFLQIDAVLRSIGGRRAR